MHENQKKVVSVLLVNEDFGARSEFIAEGVKSEPKFFMDNAFDAWILELGWNFTKLATF